MKHSALARMDAAVKRAIKASPRCTHHGRSDILGRCLACDVEALQNAVKAYQEARVELCNDLDRALERINQINAVNTALQRFAIEHCDMKYAEELRKINEAQYE